MLTVELFNYSLLRSRGNPPRTESGGPSLGSRDPREKGIALAHTCENTRGSGVHGQTVRPKADSDHKIPYFACRLSMYTERFRMR